MGGSSGVVALGGQYLIIQMISPPPPPIRTAWLAGQGLAAGPTGLSGRAENKFGLEPRPTALAVLKAKATDLGHV